jgi:hypothetical protein
MVALDRAEHLTLLQVPDFQLLTGRIEQGRRLTIAKQIAQIRMEGTLRSQA